MPSSKEIHLPILILGISGVPGFSLFRYFKKLFPGSVYGVRAVKTLSVQGEGVLAIDAEDTHSLSEAFEKYKFGTVIDAGGNCALKACELNAERSRLLNCLQGVDATRLARRFDSELIRLSTDMVFESDLNRAYLETDKKGPIHNFGKHMSEAEDLIREIFPEVVILRVPLPMDYAPGGEAGAIDWISHRFRPGRPATLYWDEYRNPIYGNDLCRVVDFILRFPIPAGIYHCGGARLVTLYQIAQIVNAVGLFRPELVHGCDRIEAGPIPPRVGRLEIDSSKLTALLPPNMIRPWPLDHRLVPDSRDWHLKVDRGLWKHQNEIHRLLVEGIYLEELL